MSNKCGCPTAEKKEKNKKSSSPSKKIFKEVIQKTVTRWKEFCPYSLEQRA